MEPGQSLEILFEDDAIIAINKPPGIMVHRSTITEDKIFILQLLRKQIKQRIYPVHRLDRGTSGVLLFAKTNSIASTLSEEFRSHRITKKYLAVIRGYVDESGVIDYPLAREKWLEKREAVSHYVKLAQSEVPFAIGPYSQSRYSLVKVQPKTGRRHQIRRHFAHLRHPVIGDKKHGDVKHNSYFTKELKIPRMLLHACELTFKHPLYAEILTISAPADQLLIKALQILKLEL